MMRIAGLGRQAEATGSARKVPGRMVAGLGGVLLGVLAAGAGQARAAEKYFTVGNYPVEAQANDAVAAKAKALSEGRAAALRSLIKRLVPVTSYGRLKELDGEKPEAMIDGMSVRSERNSSTTYIATLDFTFQAEAVRQMLERRNIPYADKAAPQMVLVPVWNGDKKLAGQGGDAWQQAWGGVDSEHALTPAKIERQKPGVHADTIKALAAGDTGMLRTFAGEYGSSELLVAAVATPEPEAGQVRVMLIGRDGAGPINWSRVYKLEGGDAAYTLELAAVVSLGVLEGRWKAITVKGGDAGGPNGGTGLPAGASPWSPVGGQDGRDSGAARGAVGRPGMGGGAESGGTTDLPGASAIQFSVEFNGMAAWQDISRRLAQVPGISDLDVAGLSGRSARVVARYTGGLEQLADAVPQYGLVLRRDGRGWIMSAP